MKGIILKKIAVSLIIGGLLTACNSGAGGDGQDSSMAAALGFLAGSNKTAGEGFGSGQMSVAGSAFSVAEIDKVEISISAADIAVPITQILTRNGDSWSGTIPSIPAGSERTFTARAYKDVNGTDLPLYEGVAPGVTVGTNATVVVIIALQDVETPAPVINAMTSNDATPNAGETIALTATATDPDGDDATLTYAWTADAACNGSFDNATTAVTNFTFNQGAAAASCQFSVTVTDLQNLSVSSNLSVNIQNGAPVLNAFNQSAVTIAPNGQVTFSVTAADENPAALVFSWTAYQGEAGTPVNTVSAGSTVSDMTWTAPACGSDLQVSVDISDDQGQTITKDFTAISIDGATSCTFTFVESIIRASDGATNDQFGYSVDIYGDLAVVGAQYKRGGVDNSLTSVGAAYVYRRLPQSDTWVQSAVLKADDGQKTDVFGRSVALDNETIVVGAPYVDADGVKTNTGAVYVFTRNGDGSWSQRQKLVASDPDKNDYFGGAVDIYSTRIVVGAYGEDGGDGNPLSSAGAVYVFEGSGSSWSQTAKLQASDRESSDYFGRSLSLRGWSLIIGADYADVGSISNAGAAYVFEKGSVWEEKVILTASDAQANDRFGYSVATDTVNMIVSAYSEDGGAGDPATSAGAAYIFNRSSAGVFTQTALLHADDFQASDNFGQCVDIDGDYAIVSAPYENGGFGDPISGAGAVYVFKKDISGNWNPYVTQRSPEAQAYDVFGYAAKLYGDQMIIGARLEDGGAGDPVSASGSAYIYRLY